MSEFLSVQMNMAETTSVQIEQSTSTSVDNTSDTSENSFNSLLKEALPKDSNEKHLQAEKQPQRASVTAENSDSPTESSPINDLKENILHLLDYISQHNNKDSKPASVDPNSASFLDLDETTLLNFLNTYLGGDSTKDIETTVAQLNQSLGSLTNSATTGEPTFGALTKNLGELQNLLTGKSGTDLTGAQNTMNLSSQQQTLLDRLQSLIANGQEAGVLSIKNITRPNQNLSLDNHLGQLSSKMQTINVDSGSVETSSLVKGDGLTALEEGVFSPALRNRQQHLSSVRHDSTQQFYDAKMQSKNMTNESTNLAGNQKDDGMQQPGSGFNQMGSPSSLNSNTDTTGTFSMTNSTLLNPLPGQTTGLSQTTMLPSGTVVQDQEVMQQLFERFQVNRRQQDTKLQLKLHPVELGKMKIDLTVKEGSIRANVIAQSQHVQEIIERNIAKLRSVLEQQGFTVEDITVTSTSETVGGFDLFDQNLNQGESFSSLSQNDKSETHTPFALDDFQENYVENSTGVNVQA